MYEDKMDFPLGVAGKNILASDIQAGLNSRQDADYYMVWFEGRNTSTVVEASSREEAISKARAKKVAGRDQPVKSVQKATGKDLADIQKGRWVRTRPSGQRVHGKAPKDESPSKYRPQFKKDEGVVFPGDTSWDSIVNYNSLNIEEESAFEDFVKEQGGDRDSSLEDLRRWFSEFEYRQDSTRESCLICVEKHLGNALSLFDEVTQGYPQHRVLAVGNLSQAADEAFREHPELAEKIRDMRHRFQVDDIIPTVDEVYELLEPYYTPNSSVSEDNFDAASPTKDTVNYNYEDNGNPCQGCVHWGGLTGRVDEDEHEEGKCKLLNDTVWSLASCDRWQPRGKTAKRKSDRQDESDDEEPDIADFLAERYAKETAPIFENWLLKLKQSSERVLDNPASVYKMLDEKAMQRTLFEMMTLSHLAGAESWMSEVRTDSEKRNLEKRNLVRKVVTAKGKNGAYKTTRWVRPNAEIYQEPGDSTFSVNDKTYDVNKMLVVAHTKKSQKFQIKDLDWVLDDDVSPDNDRDEDRIRRADPNIPIIVIPSASGDKLLVADGWHRLLKAKRSGATTIQGKLLSKEEAESARIDSQDYPLRLDSTKSPEWLKFPFKKAIAYLQRKVNIPTDSYKKMEEGYHDWAFSIAKMTKGSLLQDAKWVIQNGMEQGLSHDEMRKQWNRLIGRKGWRPGGNENRRIYTIIDTNIRSAHSSGRAQQMYEPDNLKVAPYAIWRWRDSPMPRPHHQALHNKAIALESSFFQKVTVPAGFGCRCSVFAVSRGYCERNGIEILNNPPDPTTIADPGFRYPLQGLNDEQRREIINTTLSTLDPEIRKAVEGDLS